MASVLLQVLHVVVNTLSRLSQGTLREVFNQPTYDIDVLRNGKFVNESVPDSYKCRYFPLVSKFNDFNDYEFIDFILCLSDTQLENAYEQFSNDWPFPNLGMC